LSGSSVVARDFSGIATAGCFPPNYLPDARLGYLDWDTELAPGAIGRGRRSSCCGASEAMCLPSHFKVVRAGAWAYMRE